MNFKKLTPNLVVADIERSLTFYRDILGFTVSATVPDASPFVFAWMKGGDTDIFLNQHLTPQPGQPDLFAGEKIGGTMSMYLVIEGIGEVLKKVEAHGIEIVIPLHTEFYGMKEFAVRDPDGYLIIFAEEQNRK
jgi:catechol 2,3-dioxygenase-like lactoylglutathione lyase family enzyme